MSTPNAEHGRATVPFDYGRAPKRENKDADDAAQIDKRVKLSHGGQPHENRRMVNESSDTLAKAPNGLSRESYTVGWICAVNTEYIAARQFLDEIHEGPEDVPPHDSNSYTLGRMGRHNVVVAVLPDGEYGTASAASVASNLLGSFHNVRFGLMVGIGGGAPTKRNDIRLGDVVVSSPKDGRGGVFEYKFGRMKQGQPFQPTRFLDQPPQVLRTAVQTIKAEYAENGHGIQASASSILENPRLRKKFGRPKLSEDRLYEAEFCHPQFIDLEDDDDCTTTCSNDRLVTRASRDEYDDDPVIHYGLIASADTLMKDAIRRDRLAKGKGVLCFEMETAGLMNHFPCLVIRGICDYSDTHKNKKWQGYAALTAAAYAKDLLLHIHPNKVELERRIKDTLDEMQAEICVVADDVSQMKSSQREADMQKWLSAPDPSTNLNAALKSRHESSGQWFLRSSEYSAWKSERKSFLWLKGKPGCGKTILSSTVIQDLQKLESQSRIPVLYFYFYFNDARKQSLDNMLRALMSQLYPSLPRNQNPLDTLYSSCKDGKLQPDTTSLLSTFQHMIELAGEVKIVLDGLDECPLHQGQSRRELLLWIQGLYEVNASLRVLATSRPEHDIENSLTSWAERTRSHSLRQEVISLETSLIQDDIARFIRETVLHHEDFSRWREYPDIQDTIESTLIEKADGMFRWAECQLNVLKDCYDLPSLENDLNDLPSTLGETYDHIFDRIPQKHRSKTIRLLQFLAFSERPLRIEEAVDALAVHLNEKPRFDIRSRMPRPREIACYGSSLVTVVESTNSKEGTIAMFQLSHFSVKEWLLSERQGVSDDFRETAARGVIAKVCITYLLGLGQGLHKTETIRRYPLAEYCARYWPEHAIVADEADDDSLHKTIDLALTPKSLSTCYELYCQDGEYRVNGARGKCGPVLYFAARNGLYGAMLRLISMGENVNEQGGVLGTALEAASWGGHYKIVLLLLGKGADVNAKGGFFGNALQAASFIGHDDIALTLLERGADVNAHGGNFGNALQAASFRGHGDIALVLLERGANVNAQGGTLGSPLNAASATGHLHVIKLLVDRGADLTMMNHRGCTALHIAAQSGDANSVRFLLNGGADRTFIDHYGFNPLHHASIRGDLDTVKVLTAELTPLAACAVPLNSPKTTAPDYLNIPDRYGSTPFSIAARRGHLDLVHFFLENGSTNILTKDIFGRTPFWWISGAAVTEAVMNAAQRRSLSPETARGPAHPYSTSSVSRWCNVCTMSVEAPSTYYHCNKCLDGDFDICSDCHTLGAICPIPVHVLERRHKIRQA